MSEVVHLDGRRINWNDPPPADHTVRWSKRSYNGKKVVASLRTICHLDRLNTLAVKHFDSAVTVIQPPYNTTVSASAGTHDFDACSDLCIYGVGWYDQQRFFRANGFACWYRHPPLFGNHIHGFTLPPHSGDAVSDDFDQRGFTVGIYIDGGWSTKGSLVTSAQIDDYYNHAFGLSGMHDPGSDNSWFPKSIESTIFDLQTYVQHKRRH